MEEPRLPRKSTPWRRGLLALALSGGATVIGAVEFTNQTPGHASAEVNQIPTAWQQPSTSQTPRNVHEIKRAQAQARRAAQLKALAALAAAEATTTTTTTTTTIPPTTTTSTPPTTLPASGTVSAASYSGGSDATNAFTPNWYRCVINPESGGHPNEPGTGGEFGFLDSTWTSSPYVQIWQSQQPAGADWSQPWKAPLNIQEQDALLLFRNNGGFGPSAWNNRANCGKNG